MSVNFRAWRRQDKLGHGWKNSRNICTMVLSSFSDDCCSMFHRYPFQATCRNNGQTHCIQWQFVTCCGACQTTTLLSTYIRTGQTLHFMEGTQVHGRDWPCRRDWPCHLIWFSPSNTQVSLWCRKPHSEQWSQHVAAALPNFLVSNLRNQKKRTLWLFNIAMERSTVFNR